MSARKVDISSRLSWERSERRAVFCVAAPPWLVIIAVSLGEGSFGCRIVVRVIVAERRVASAFESAVAPFCVRQSRRRPTTSPWIAR